MCGQHVLELTASLMSAEGKAKMIDRHTVEVALAIGGTRRLTARHILLAQGGIPVRADVPGKVLTYCADSCNTAFACNGLFACYLHAMFFSKFNPRSLDQAGNVRSLPHGIS